MDKAVIHYYDKGSGYMVEQLLKDAIEKVNKEIEENEKYKKELEGKVRNIAINITDGKQYKFRLENNKFVDFSEGVLESPDIVVTADMKTMRGLLLKEIKPMKAYALGKIKLKAKLEDLMLIKKLL